jgi:tRNA (cmo5U34)-methyltransferase
MSQFHFDPATYDDLMRAEVPHYPELQEQIALAGAGAGAGVEVVRWGDLGTGTGEVVVRGLVHHPSAKVIGVDVSPPMLGVAWDRLTGFDVDLRVADLAAPLPDGPFDLVTSALAIHHLDGPATADLFERIAAVLRPGGRFVLGDVVIPEDASAAVVPLSDDYDKPSTLADQVLWLGQAGLVVAVRWQEDDLVVLTADRPA